ncbi:Vesicle transport protein SFT2B [Liparis tanakae]|uniref:Vesicle transport protein n=1 Tax=Liparis tanakae TaxID=230148 RepID=A0A4Z2F556_9TELE|nr:Vesicle transport protein SFT2B [Liparis tanakae]
MDKLKSVLSGEEARAENRTIAQTVNEASTLGWGTRVKGFVACFVVGGVCAVLGVCLLFLPKVGIILFIVFYTFGNLCTLFSTMFLMGPMKQVKRMCDKTRALATTLMITCLVLTLCAVFWWKNFGLALLFVILQVLSFAWYSLSYIPFIRDAIMKMVSVCIKR